MSWDALADVGFVCDKTAVFCVTDPVNAYCSVLVTGHDVDEGGRLSSPHWIINSSWYLGEMVGTAVAQWLRCCATNRKVGGFFIDIKTFRSHYGPGVDSASNRIEYQEYFLGVKAVGA